MVPCELSSLSKVAAHANKQTNKLKEKKTTCSNTRSEILVHHSVKAVTSGHAHGFKTLLADARAAQSITIKARVLVRKQAPQASRMR
jgi:hypothetical protein